MQEIGRIGWAGGGKTDVANPDVNPDPDTVKPFLHCRKEDINRGEQKMHFRYI